MKSTEISWKSVHKAVYRNQYSSLGVYVHTTKRRRSQMCGHGQKQFVGPHPPHLRLVASSILTDLFWLLCKKSTIRDQKCTEIITRNRKFTGWQKCIADIYMADAYKRPLGTLTHVQAHCTRVLPFVLCPTRPQRSTINISPIAIIYSCQPEKAWLSVICTSVTNTN